MPFDFPNQPDRDLKLWRIEAVVEGQPIFSMVPEGVEILCLDPINASQVGRQAVVKIDAIAGRVFVLGVMEDQSSISPPASTRKEFGFPEGFLAFSEHGDCHVKCRKFIVNASGQVGLNGAWISLN